MPADEHIEKFIYILQPLISIPLLGHCYTDIKDLLDKAINIEDMKKDIIINFSKQKRFTTLKSTQRPRKSTKRSAKRSAGLVKFVAGLTNTKKTLQELIRTAYIQTRNLDL